ncbi:hypothetical protein B0H17DRAFT_1216277 [Mycena rosella]|uniref:SET domain-containing protein n=1 Tax=Mycena rosella TaxID=1033263 RepID=A0AAD7C9J0_MYCRO|nr:hypothetical protein B0H17DRAFT_1216277 [Mycena rosella]
MAAASIGPRDERAGEIAKKAAEMWYANETTTLTHARRAAKETVLRKWTEKWKKTYPREYEDYEEHREMLRKVLEKLSVPDILGTEKGIQALANFLNREPSRRQAGRVAKRNPSQKATKKASSCPTRRFLFKMGDGVWPNGTQKFVLHNAPIYDGDEDDGFPSPSGEDSSPTPPPPSPDPPYFFVGDAGWKGAGLFAARDIPAGALILVDRPIAIVPSNVRTREVFDAVLPRLSHRSRDRLLALANCKPLTEYPVVEGIALTNAVQVALPVPPDAPPQEYGAVFPLVCRANHSCGLNASVKWDPASFSASMYALRAYRKGEEILNQYIDVLTPRAKRQADLVRYGFTCACAHCAEGMHGLRVPFLDDCARAHALLGDAEGFRECAQEVVQLCVGLDAERAEMFARWIEDPSTYEGWGTRARDRILFEKRKEREPDPDDLDISVPW